MGEAGLRRRWLSMLAGAKYQEIKDSPTIAYYTDWSVYDEYCECEVPEGAVKVEGPVAPATPRLPEPDPKMPKIVAKHFASLVYSAGFKLLEDGSYSFRVLPSGREGVYEGFYILIEVPPRRKARVRILEESEADSCVGVWLEVLVGMGAELRVEILRSNRGAGYARRRFVLEEGSKVVLRQLIDGPGRMHREDVSVTLAGAGSSADAMAAVIASGGEKADYVFYGSEESESNSLTFRGYGLALDGSTVSIRAVGVASTKSRRGRIVVSTDLYNLGDGSLAVGSPELRIDTDDLLEARHSVKISNLGDEAVFYMRSRGLKLEEIAGLLREEIKRLVLAEKLDGLE